jgi:hypothetical protein
MFVILPVTYVLIETSLTLFTLSNVTNAVREGARAGALYQYPACNTTDTTCPLNPTVYAFNQLVGTIDTARSSVIRQEIQNRLGPLVAFSQCQVGIGYSVPPPTPAPTPQPGNPYRAGEQLIVNLTCPRRLLFGLVNANQVNLSGSATMKIEPGGVRNP